MATHAIRKETAGRCDLCVSLVGSPAQRWPNVYDDGNGGGLITCSMEASFSLPEYSPFATAFSKEANVSLDCHRFGKLRSHDVPRSI
jgi:hypothetical protein